MSSYNYYKEDGNKKFKNWWDRTHPVARTRVKAYEQGSKDMFEEIYRELTFNFCSCQGQTRCTPCKVAADLLRIYEDK